MSFGRSGHHFSGFRRLLLLGLVSFLTVVMFAPQTVVYHRELAAQTSVAGDYNIIIYGGTPSGIAAAIAADKSVSRILLISERETVGGAISNGLGAVDIGARFAVTGIARDFFTNVQKYYGDHTMWRTEPHVAESIFLNMLRKTHVKLAMSRTLVNTYISEGQITCLLLDGGTRVCAKQFVDASYTGDLIAQSHSAHVLAPADLYAYHEPEAARRHFARMGSFRDLDPKQVATAIRSIPYIHPSATMPFLEGMVDRGSPSWTYRLCLTQKNKRPFTPGANYNKYIDAWRILLKAQYPRGECRHWCRVKPNGTIQTKLWQIVRLPNGKYDLNAGTAQLTNFPIGRDYFLKPETRISAEHRLQSYLESFLYFAQHDDSVPPFERRALAGFGLCADEFITNHNWPFAPYIRGGTRIIGRSTLTTANIMQHRTSTQSVAIGSYLLDNKSSQLVYWNGAVYRDVGSFLKAPVYEIPFGSLLPKHGPNNLLSSVNISSSMTAFGSVRIEAQFMELGQAAGTASAISVQHRATVADISISELESHLRKGGLVTSIVKLCQNLDADNRARHSFDRITCQPRHFTQATPYDSLYGQLPR